MLVASCPQNTNFLITSATTEDDVIFLFFVIGGYHHHITFPHCHRSDNDQHQRFFIVRPMPSLRSCELWKFHDVLCQFDL